MPPKTINKYYDIYTKKIYFQKTLNRYNDIYTRKNMPPTTNTCIMIFILGKVCHQKL